MQVDDFIRKCIVFLGAPAPRGFVAHGTGFLITIDEGEHSDFYIISARHVVWPRSADVKGGVPQGEIHVRVNRKKGAPKLFKTLRSEWIFHPDGKIDLCALPLDLHDEERGDPGEEADWAHIALPSMAHTLDKAAWSGISLGDEVFITGAFVNRLGIQKNIPIVRIGHIAAMPEEPIEIASPKRPAYLIETRSLGGISGSPVFLNLQGRRIRGRLSFGPVGIIPADRPDQRKEKIIFPYLLIGMIIYVFGGNDPFDMGASTEERRETLSDIEFNSGISVAIDVNDILAFLETSAVKNPRLASIEARRKQTGA